MVANVWLWSKGWTGPILLVSMERLFLETGGYSKGSGHILIWFGKCREHLEFFVLCFSGVKITVSSLVIFVQLSRLARETTQEPSFPAKKKKERGGEYVTPSFDGRF